MKIIVIFLIFGMIYQASSSRSVTFESFEYLPKESDLLDYGTLALKQSINSKSNFVLNGNFTIKRTMGNEKLMVFEVKSRGLLLIKNTYAFCEYIRIEKNLWPYLVKASNMPQDNPCPFPAVSFQ